MEHFKITIINEGAKVHRAPVIEAESPRQELCLKFVGRGSDQRKLPQAYKLSKGQAGLAAKSTLRRPKKNNLLIFETEKHLKTPN